MLTSALAKRWKFFAITWNMQWFWVWKKWEFWENLDNHTAETHWEIW